MKGPFTVVLVGSISIVGAQAKFSLGPWQPRTKIETIFELVTLLLGSTKEKERRHWQFADLIRITGSEREGLSLDPKTKI